MDKRALGDLFELKVSESVCYLHAKILRYVKWLNSSLWCTCKVIQTMK
jgi:hypothetical protein